MKQIRNLNIPVSLGDVCDPRRMALLVYDMQVGIVGQIKEGNLIVAKVHAIIKAARVAGIRIVYTRHLSLPIEWMGSAQFRMAMTWQRKENPADVSPWFLRDNPAFQIVPELAPEPADAVFDKIAMSAFEGTPLATALRDCGLSAVAIAGIAMEIGIEPTARHAADLGFVPVIIADACGAGHASAAIRSLDALKFAGDAMITDTQAFCSELAK